ncbi:uncharacterized protein LOC117503135 isoform X2 [Thalassophryne amazonica]|uniref:uncharacterized protein LOC117503135 isoform X2 n=1 Tax=Thalassophryne amazonica TaxID=390379 RepID=UPI001470CE80|nr:uncharacterized protein LOC117503135 isoform X2 [Thalassophryne amazonica]
MSDSPEEQPSTGVLGRIGSWFSPWRTKVAPKTPENASPSCDQSLGSAGEKQSEESVRAQAREEAQSSGSDQLGLSRDICEEGDATQSAHRGGLTVGSSEPGCGGPKEEEFAKNKRKRTGQDEEKEEGSNGTPGSRNSALIETASCLTHLTSSSVQGVALHSDQALAGRRLHVYLEETSVIHSNQDAGAQQQVVRTEVKKELQVRSKSKSSIGSEDDNTNAEPAVDTESSPTTPKDLLEPEADDMGRKNPTRRRPRKNSQGDGESSSQDSTLSKAPPEGLPASDKSRTAHQGECSGESSISSASTNNPASEASPEGGQDSSTSPDGVKDLDNITASLTHAVDGGESMDDNDSLYRVERKTETPESKRRSIKVSRSEVKLFTKNVPLRADHNLAGDKKGFGSVLKNTKDEVEGKPKPDSDTRLLGLKKIAEEPKSIIGRIADRIHFFEPQTAAGGKQTLQTPRSADVSPVRKDTEKLKSDVASSYQKSKSAECHDHDRSTSASPAREKMPTVMECARNFTEASGTVVRKAPPQKPAMTGMSKKNTRSALGTTSVSTKLDIQDELDSKARIQVPTLSETRVKPDDRDTTAVGVKPHFPKEESTKPKTNHGLEVVKTIEQEINSVKLGISAELTSNINQQPKGPGRPGTRSKRRKSKEPASPISPSSESKLEQITNQQEVILGQQEVVDNRREGASAAKQPAETVSLQSHKPRGSASDKDSLTDRNQRALKKTSQSQNTPVDLILQRDSTEKPGHVGMPELSVSKNESDTTVCSSRTTKPLDKDPIILVQKDEGAGGVMEKFPEDQLPQQIIEKTLSLVREKQVGHPESQLPVQSESQPKGEAKQPQNIDLNLNHPEIKDLTKAQKLQSEPQDLLVSSQNNAKDTALESGQRVSMTNGSVATKYEKKHTEGKVETKPVEVSAKQELESGAFGPSDLIVHIEPLNQTAITHPEMGAITKSNKALRGTINDESGREPFAGVVFTDVPKLSAQPRSETQPARTGDEPGANSVSVEKTEKFAGDSHTHGANDAEFPSSKPITKTTKAAEKVNVKGGNDTPLQIMAQVAKESSIVSDEKPFPTLMSKSVSHEGAKQDARSTSSVVESVALGDKGLGDIKKWAENHPQCEISRNAGDINIPSENFTEKINSAGRNSCAIETSDKIINTQVNELPLVAATSELPKLFTTSIVNSEPTETLKAPSHDSNTIQHSNERSPMAFEKGHRWPLISPEATEKTRQIPSTSTRSYRKEEISNKTLGTEVTQKSCIAVGDVDKVPQVHTVGTELLNSNLSQALKTPASTEISNESLDSNQKSFIKKRRLPWGRNRDSVTQDAPSSWLDVDIPKQKLKVSEPRLSSSGSESNLLDASSELDDEDFIERIKNLCAPFSLPPRKHNPLRQPQPPFAMPAIKEDHYEKTFDPEEFTFGLRQIKFSFETTTGLLAKLQSKENKPAIKPARASLADRSMLLNSLDSCSHLRDKSPVKGVEPEEKDDQPKLKSRLERSRVLSSLYSSSIRDKRNGFQEETESSSADDMSPREPPKSGPLPLTQPSSQSLMEPSLSLSPQTIPPSSGPTSVPKLIPPSLTQPSSPSLPETSSPSLTQSIPTSAPKPISPLATQPSPPSLPETRPPSLTQAIPTSAPKPISPSVTQPNPPSLPETSPPSLTQSLPRSMPKPIPPSITKPSPPSLPETSSPTLNHSIPTSMPKLMPSVTQPSPPSLPETGPPSLTQFRPTSLSQPIPPSATQPSPSPLPETSPSSLPQFSPSSVPQPLMSNPAATAPLKDKRGQQSLVSSGTADGQSTEAVVSDSCPSLPSFNDIKLPEYLEKYLHQDGAKPEQSEKGQEEAKMEDTGSMTSPVPGSELDLKGKPSLVLPDTLSFPRIPQTTHSAVSELKQQQGLVSQNVRITKGFHRRPGKMVLFEKAQFSGQEYEIYRDVADATSLQLSTLISVKIVRGCWVLYEKPDFQGRSIPLEEGCTELTNVWAESDLETQPEINPPVLIGSIRLVVWDYSIPHIDLFAEPEGRGRITAYNDDVVETGTFGIPLTTASIQVHSGVWLVFSDPGYQGVLGVLEAGVYPFPETWGFPAPFVGSLRPLKMGGFKVENPNEVKAVVYEEPGFRGPCLEIESDVFSFSEGEEDDAPDQTNLDATKPKCVGSLKITGGLWVGYSLPGFEGQQHILEEGEYVDCSDWGGGPECLLSLRPIVADFMSPHLKMFSDRDFGERGINIDLTVPIINMEHTGYGLRTQSIEVINGVWVVFEEPGFCGDSYILEKGLYGSPEDWGALEPRIAAAMPVMLGDWENTSKFKVQLFSEPDFQGRILTVEDSVGSLQEGFSVASCKVLAGNWLAFEGQDFTGKMYVLEEGRYADVRAMGCTSARASIQSLQTAGFEFSLPSITLFERGALRGKRVVLTDAAVNLQLAAGCSRVQSVLVEGGMWVLYEGLNYRGAQILLKPGDVPNWRDFSGWQKIGSLRPLAQKQVHFHLKNRQTGWLMSITGELDDIKLIRIQETEETNGPEQIWAYRNGFLHCRLLEECCLSPSGTVTMAGSRVGVTPELEAQIHLWNITPEGFIQYTASGLVLEVKGGHNYDKNQVILNMLEPHKLNQRWDVEII